jgi:hypothetical protein
MMNNKVEINLEEIRKKFKTKQDVIKFFDYQGKIFNFILGKVFPDYDFYDFEYFIQILEGKKHVRIFYLPAASSRRYF